MDPWINIGAGVGSALAACINGWRTLPKVPEQYRLKLSIANIGGILAAVLFGVKAIVDGEPIIATIIFISATASLAAYIYQLRKIYRRSS